MQNRMGSRPPGGGRLSAARQRELERLFLEAFPPEKRSALLGALTEKALAGDVRAAAFLFDRIYGRPGAAPKPAESDETDGEHCDLRRLDDREMDVLDCLLEKCVVRDDPRDDSE